MVWVCMDGKTENSAPDLTQILKATIVKALGDKNAQDKAPDGIPLDRVLSLIRFAPGLHGDWRWQRLSKNNRWSALHRVLEQMVEEGIVKSKPVDLGKGEPETCYSLKP